MTSHYHLSVAPLSLWLSFLVGIVLLLILDLFLFSKSHKTANMKFALIESGFWILISLAFNFWFAKNYGSKHGVDFLTAYLVEKSLSVDNLFVILLVFKSLKIPQGSQHRVLYYGILGAIVLRGLFILIGAQLVHSFHWIFYIFGVILIYTAYNILTGHSDDDDIEVQEKWILKKIKTFLPTTEKLNGEKFFVLENGFRKATPLFLALIAVEASDIIFAVDSIPAVFAITQDSFVAFASNILAVLGLRALYFVLADGAQKLLYLNEGLALILSFIGLKMLISDFIYIPSWISLALIAAVITIIVLITLLSRKKKRKSNP